MGKPSHGTTNSDIWGFNMENELTDRQKINIWLDSINETDQATRDEVMEHCRIDREARAFYVQKYDEDCK